MTDFYPISGRRRQLIINIMGLGGMAGLLSASRGIALDERNSNVQKISQQKIIETQQHDQNRLRRQNPPRRGEMQNFLPYTTPRKIPMLEFTNDKEEIIDLTAYRGRIILLTLWAVWCPPCVKEMPSLDRLQASYKQNQLHVLPLSLDRGGLMTVRPFYEKLQLRHLGIYLDPHNHSMRVMQADGVPKSWIIDRNGHPRGEFTGAARWDAPEAKNLLDWYIDDSPTTDLPKSLAL